MQCKVDHQFKRFQSLRVLERFFASAYVLEANVPIADYCSINYLSILLSAVLSKQTSTLHYQACVVRLTRYAVERLVSLLVIHVEECSAYCQLGLSRKNAVHPMVRLLARTLLLRQMSAPV